MLVPGICQNDMLLEVVLLLSSISGDMKALDVLVKTNVISQLYNLWQEKSSGDTELCLQMIHLFHKLLMHDACREEVRIPPDHPSTATPHMPSLLSGSSSHIPPPYV